eukprot:CAMPEP_0179002160 /NCGR_PEP_ID=MMETSP0795-20121207/11820_1 /TAXON_ID=88552 /ORGANISM="Amoebophrya sp., Strain Ameob2" /LENGTH=161 /DNA_ID=CAMNT_0020695731 /DNA_START=81 /DNA_END=566 /DNA_ORIENTATION=-
MSYPFGSPVAYNSPPFGAVASPYAAPGYAPSSYGTAFGSPGVGPVQSPYGMPVSPFGMQQQLVGSPVAQPNAAGMGQALLQAAFSQQQDEQKEMIAIEVHHQRLNRVEDVVEGLARETSMVATDHEMRMRKVEEFLAEQIQRMRTNMQQEVSTADSVGAKR